MPHGVSVWAGRAGGLGRVTAKKPRLHVQNSIFGDIYAHIPGKLPSVV